jgi:hypothetical protein
MLTAYADYRLPVANADFVVDVFGSHELQTPCSPSIQDRLATRN